MTTRRRTNRRRGEPLLALALLMVAWIGARMLLWHSPFPSPFTAVAATSATLGQSLVPPVTGEPSHRPAPIEAYTRRLTPARTRSKAHPGAVSAALPATDESRLSALLIPERMGSHTTFSPTAIATPPGEALIVQWNPAVPLQRARRWHLDGWVAWRAGSGVPRRANGPRPVSYGGTQAGAIARLDLAGGSHRPEVHLRTTYAPDRFRQADIATGVGMRPIAALPVRIIGEVRATYSQGRTEVRPAVLAVTEFAPIELPLGLIAEGYSQAGWVGGRYATAFVDGQARLTRQVHSFGRARVHVGVGAWGGAQKFAERLDTGPTIGLDMGGGPVFARLSLDYRVQVSGNATPGNGPTLTLSTGF